MLLNIDDSAELEVIIRPKSTVSSSKEVNLLKQILKELMVSREQFNARIDELVTQINAEADEVKSAIDSLQAKIAEASVPIDFGPELEKLNQVSQHLHNIYVAPEQEQPATEDTPPAEEQPVVEEPVQEGSTEEVTMPEAGIENTDSTM